MPSKEFGGMNIASVCNVGETWDWGIWCFFDICSPVLELQDWAIFQVFG